MDFIKKNKNKVVIAIVLVFVFTFVYNYTKNEPAADVEERVVGGNDEVAINILTTLNKLNETEIDQSFFKEDLGHTGSSLISFFDLIDFSEKEIPEKPKGKNNPFLDKSVLTEPVGLSENEEGDGQSEENNQI